MCDVYYPRFRKNNEVTTADITVIAIQYVVLLFSLCVHEAAHAVTADRCGDPTARLLGRVTLNPLKHIDPIGTVVMPLLMMTTGIPYLFGWAKPVPFNPINLKNMRRDPVLIAIAGPVSNLLLAAFFVFLARIVVLLDHAGSLPFDSSLLILFFAMMVLLNLILAVFNIIPVPPLDGGHVLRYFLPESGRRMMDSIGPFGIIIAIFLARPVFARLNPLFDAVLGFAIGA